MEFSAAWATGADESRAFQPERNGMPSLEHLGSKNVLNVMLNALHGKVVPVPARVPVNYLARLMDKTIISYESARTELDVYISRRSDSTFSPLFRAIDHLETCVDS